MADIFISYDSDDRPRVQPLAEALEKQGWSVFWDRTILPGRDFAKVIEEELEQAKSVVVLWSHNSIASKWVKDEAAEGDKRGILVPVFIDDVQAPMGMRGIQAANLINWNNQTDHSEFTALINAIFKKAGLPSGKKAADFEEPTHQGQATQPAPGHPPSKENTIYIADPRAQLRQRLIIAGSVTFIVLIIVVFQYKRIGQLLSALWGYDPFLVYYIICVSVVTTLYGVLLKFTDGEMQARAIKSGFLLIGFLVIIAVVWRGIDVLTYAIYNGALPFGLCKKSSYLPYIALFAIAVSIMVCIIFMFTREPSKSGNRATIYNYFVKFCMSLITLRLLWEVIDRIAIYHKPCP